MSLFRVFAPIATASIKHSRQMHQREHLSTTASLEHIFIRGLVAAGTCHNHRQAHPHPHQHGKERRRISRNGNGKGNGIQRRHYSTPQRQYQPQSSVQISREEYTDLVDIYPSFEPDDDRPKQPLPPQRPPHYPLASRLTLTPAQESESQPEPKEHIPHPPESEEHAAQLRHLHTLLRLPLGQLSHTALWEAYTTLPSPRPAYLSTKSLNRLFRHLSWTEFKSTPGASDRYFALLNEVLSHPSIPLQDGIWNSAISFAGRWMRNVSSQEVKAAVGVWMRMEERGVAASEVTFNILYDLAVRAGRFALAGTIEGELKTRGLPLNRYFRTSVIYHAGLRRDGEGVRRAFRELVDAGEIVDTGVMNCVILSLLRAGEAGAAGSVFLRMKKLHEEKFGGDQIRDWREMKSLGIHLDKEARRLRDEEGVHERSFFGGTFSSRGKREVVQRAAPIEPDARTYRILIGWAVECGELGKARELVEEMRGRGCVVYGSVWVGLLRGFGKFGGFVGGEWNSRELEAVWKEVLDSLDDAPAPSPADGGEEDDDDGSPPIPETSRPTYFTRGLALAAVHAFYKCMGRARMLEVWGVIQEKWIAQGVSEEELESVRRVVNGLRSMDEEGYQDEERKEDHREIDRKKSQDQDEDEGVR